MKNQSVAVMQYPAPTTLCSITPEKLLRSVIDVICVVDLQGIFRYMSPACETLFGYTAEEMTGASFRNFIHPADISKTIRVVAERQHDCRTSNFDNRYIRKDGSMVPVFWSGRWDENDGLLYCVARNGTEKLEVEQRLVNAQRMARVANYEFDMVNNRYTYVSDTMFEIFGLDRNVHPDFTSALFWSLVHPADVQKLEENLWLPPGPGTASLEYRILRPDGTAACLSRFREVIRDAAGNPVKSIGTIQDITERKHTELAVQQSEEKLQALVQNGNDLVGIIDLNGTYCFVASNVQEQLGYPAAELVGRNALDFIHAEDAPAVRAVLQEVARLGTVTVGPFRFRNSGGEWRWMETTVSNHLHNPTIRGLVVNSRDVTEKKLHDDALRQSEQRFKALVQNGSDLIVVMDINANFSYSSDNIINVLGYTREEMQGRNAYSFIHPDDVQKVMLEIEAVMRNDGSATGVQHRFLHKSGKWIWMESHGTDHHLTPSIHGILVNSRDITDRVRLQRRLNRELIKKQKEITSAVIRAQEAERSQLGLELHDNVNQILTTVKLYNEMYLSGYVQDKELLVKSTQFTQDCINEIRSISKRLSAPTLGQITLEDSVRELVNSINLTRRIEIIYVPKEISRCCVSEELHLAVYRIVQEGVNNILKYSQAKVACIEIFRRAGHLCLKISDNGKGFDVTVKRTGIGITNMKTRTENLHGTFRLASEPGKGCEIEISFPCEGCAMAGVGAEGGNREFRQCSATEA